MISWYKLRFLCVVLTTEVAAKLLDSSACSSAQHEIIIIERLAHKVLDINII
jgi:hypothetical protein